MFPKKQVDQRKKNTKREITEELFEECLARDWWCVICRATNDLDRPHHVLYGQESDFGPSRNKATAVVTICRPCHHKLHFEWGNNYRELTKQYLKWLYQ